MVDFKATSFTSSACDWEHGCSFVLWLYISIHHEGLQVCILHPILMKHELPVGTYTNLPLQLWSQIHHNGNQAALCHLQAEITAEDKCLRENQTLEKNRSEVFRTLTGLVSRCRMSWGHMEGVRAEKGPPGVGSNSEYLGTALMCKLASGPDSTSASSSSSEPTPTVSAVKKHKEEHEQSAAWEIIMTEGPRDPSQQGNETSQSSGDCTPNVDVCLSGNHINNGQLRWLTTCNILCMRTMNMHEYWYGLCTGT